MKVAVCVSGICRGNVRRNMEIVKNIFELNDKDFFYSTWKGREEDCEKENIKDFYVFDEPQINYHPLADVPEEVMIPTKKMWDLRERCKREPFIRDRFAKFTKQIIGHSYLLKEVPDEYDMIIRIRYDTFVSKRVKKELNDWLKESYEKNKAVGFGTRTSRHKRLDMLYSIPKIWDERWRYLGVSNDWGGFIMDPMIFHPRRMFNHKLMWRLHNSKSLMIAECGWYQILSKPYGDNHESIYGGAQIEKYLKDTLGW